MIIKLNNIYATTYCVPGTVLSILYLCTEIEQTPWGSPKNRSLVFSASFFFSFYKIEIQLIDNVSDIWQSDTVIHI